MVNKEKAGAFPIRRPKGSFPSPYDLINHHPKHYGLRLALLRCGKPSIYPSSTNNNHIKDSPTINKAGSPLKKNYTRLLVEPDTIPLLESIDEVDFSR
jgi:hypothetical protein